VWVAKGRNSATLQAFFGRFEGLSGCHRSGSSMVMPPQQR
jgi:hypothetical protein